MEIHPRPQGRANTRQCVGRAATGPSAPARARRFPTVLKAVRTGSIRARTDAPCCWRLAAIPAWVHPRPHGRAGTHAARRQTALGPSAPARTRPPPKRGADFAPGSIRARTDAPSVRPMQSTSARVHPRPHGRASPNQPIASPRITPPMHANIARTLHLHVSKIRAGQAPMSPMISLRMPIMSTCDGTAQASLIDKR